MRSSRRLLGLVLVCCGAVLAQGSTAQSPHVNFIDVPDAGTGFGQGTFPVAMNKLGWITGYYVRSDYSTHGFLRTPQGDYLVFDAPGQNTVPTCLNGTGEIAGSFLDALTSQARGFVRAADGTITVFDAPGADGTADEQTWPTGISNDGHIAGTERDPAHVSHGFLRSPDGKFVRFDAPGAGSGHEEGTFVAGMSDKDYITGWFVFNSVLKGGYVRSSNGSITTFAIPTPGAITPAQGGVIPFSLVPGGGAEGRSINMGGTVVGDYVENSREHAFLRFANGKVTTFTLQGTASGTTSKVDLNTLGASINNEGVMAGVSVDEGGVSHAFVRLRNGTVEQLSLPLDSTPTRYADRFNGTAAQQITDLGGVVGYYTGASYVYHGFVWWP